MRRAHKNKDKTVEYDLSVYEVYYDDNGEPEMHSMEPDSPHGETLEELRDDVKHYLIALDRPVLNFEGMKEIKNLSCDEENRSGKAKN